MPGDYRVEKWTEVYAPNPAMLRHLMTLEGYEVCQWSERPGMVFGPRKFQEDRSHWIVSGTLELHVHGKGIVILHAGDRDFIPAGLYHSGKVAGDELLVYLMGHSKKVKTSKARTKRSRSKKR